MISERHARIALNTLPGVGAIKVKTLLEAFGSLGEVANVSAYDICTCCAGISESTAEAILQTLHSSRAQEEEAKAERCSVTILTALDEAWPPALNELDSPPLCLYCAGDTRLLSATQIAIVGTRRASLYGKDQATRYARYLSTIGIHITSGLAEGIDTAAHEGALQGESGQGKTIAVIGAALDCLYPQNNRPLARKIVQQGGLVVSEYPFGRHADAKTFPQRNRITVALSRAVLIVETPFRGGTMNTVTHAVKLNRPCFALPGRLEWPSFYGNHKLIHEGTARLIYSPEHILDGLQDFLASGHPAAGQQPFTLQEPAVADNTPIGLNENELALWQAIGVDGCDIDTLATRVQIPLPSLLATLSMLQVRQKVKALPGGIYART